MLLHPEKELPLLLKACRKYETRINERTPDTLGFSGSRYAGFLRSKIMPTNNLPPMRDYLHADHEGRLRWLDNYDLSPDEIQHLRENTLQAEVPSIKMIFTTPGTTADEAALHKKFAEFRLRGEWFQLSKEQIKTITKGAL